MVRIQLIGEQEGYLDVKEGSSFPINISLSDIRDIGTKTATITKTIVLVGSANNNKLLNYYFDVNIQAGLFDINRVQECIVLQDGVPVMDNAYLRLTSVVMQGNDIEYTAIVGTNTSNLFSVLGQKELTDLDFSDLTHTYNSLNVVGTFNNTYVDGYKYLMPYSTYSEYQLNEFRPAIYVRTYMDRIMASAGFTYEFYDGNNFFVDKLIIPYNGDQIKIDPEYINDNLVIATKTQQLIEPTTTGGVISNSTIINPFIVDTEVQDIENNYAPNTGRYTSPVSVAGLSGTIDYIYNFDLEIILNNPSGSTAYLMPNTGTGTATLSFQIYIDVYRNGSYYRQILLNRYDANRYSIPSGNTSILDANFTKVQGIDGVLENDILTTRLRLVVTGGHKWRSGTTSSSSTVDVTADLDLTNIQLKISPNITAYGFGLPMDMNRVIPQKIKQSEFIKGLCSMFNLLMFEEGENHIVFRTRDSYYNAGDDVDWTSKIDYLKPREIQFLPEISDKRVIVTYKSDSDVANKGYEQEVRETYGSLEFVFDNDYNKTTKRQEVLFSPTPIAQTTFGAVVPIINGFAPKTNIRILYDAGEKPCGQFRINDHNAAGRNSTTYPAITHFDNALNPTYDLNFGVCDYYFYPLQSFTYNNLFNLFFRKTFNQINKGRLMTCYVKLNSTDIFKLKLNSRIKIYNTYWNINKVIDYNANAYDTTKVELVSVEDGATTFETIVKIIPDATPTSAYRVIDEFSKEQTPYTNVIYGSNVDIKGRGNYVVGDNVVVVGDSNVVNGSGVIAATSDTIISGDSAIVDGSSGFITDEFGFVLLDENGNNLTQ
jgi:hypothetical protein